MDDVSNAPGIKTEWQDNPPPLNIDWALLRKQYDWLLEQSGPEAQGLINLIEALYESQESK
jgi:hypothetical protein